MSASGDLRPRHFLPSPAAGPSRALAAGVVSVLAAAALAALFALYTDIRLYALLEGDGGFTYAAQDDLDRAEALFGTAGRLQGFTFGLCALLFVGWFHSMRRAAGALAPEAFRRGPGWAVGSWFIPLASFWLPYRIAVEMWGAFGRGVRSGGGAASGAAAALWPVNLWWGLFVAELVYGRYAVGRYRKAEGLLEIRDAALQVMAADVLQAAAGAAVYVVVRLTAMRERGAGTTA